MPVPFGATPDGVGNYLPELPIEAGQKINPDRVTAFLEEVGGRVAGAVSRGLAAAQVLADADPTLQPDVDEFTTAARRLTELGAAAYTQDAAYPEMAAAAETDQRYGAVLWGRFEAGLATLTGNLAGWLIAHQESGEGAPAGIASSFPPPLIRRDIRW